MGNDQTPSFLAFNLGEAKILTTVTPGMEYKLRIEAAEMKMSGSGVSYINCRVSIIDHPESKNVFFPLFGLNSDADDSQVKRYESDMKEFAEAIGYNEPDGFHPELLVGKEGWNILTEEEYKGSMVNKVGRWVTGN